RSHFLAELDDGFIDVLVEQFAACPSKYSVAIVEHCHGAIAQVAPQATAFALRRNSGRMSPPRPPISRGLTGSLLRACRSRRARSTSIPSTRMKGIGSRKPTASSTRASNRSSESMIRRTSSDPTRTFHLEPCFGQLPYDALGLAQVAQV